MLANFVPTRWAAACPTRDDEPCAIQRVAGVIGEIAADRWGSLVQVMGTPAAAPLDIGRYRIYDKIASGGMASVHVGRLRGEAGFSRTVAVKRLHAHLAEDPQFVAILIDEARLSARIHHPNVVPTLDVIASNGELLLIMEYVRGESLSLLLRKEVERDRRVTPAIATAVAIGALHGLHAAHEATNDHGEPLGIVHRDVSPQNILVGVDGVARIIDFGIAKAAGRLQTTREGSLKGKTAYMAPEQLTATRVTRAADIYAMGVVLWETLTCTRLFEEDDHLSVIERVQAGAKDPPSRYAPEVSREVDAIVMRALARDPTDRFATALEMADELARAAPPAFATLVGAWCAEVADSSLLARGRLVAQIESDSADSPAPVAARLSLGSDEERVSASANRVLASEPSSVSLETPKPGTPARAKRPLVPLLASTGAVVAAGIAVALWMGRSQPRTSSGADKRIDVSQDAGASSPPVDAQTLPVEASKPPDVVTKRKPDTVPTRVSKPSVPKPSCNPPFVIDSLGHRVYKQACL
jgi:eukaryotic-like serine/threonine-protein kinase